MLGGYVSGGSGFSTLLQQRTEKPIMVQMLCLVRPVPAMIAPDAPEMTGRANGLGIDCLCGMLFRCDINGIGCAIQLAHIAGLALVESSDNRYAVANVQDVSGACNNAIVAAVAKILENMCDHSAASA